ncbi:MAG: SdrD B-like domain-containing protein [Heteroscytonema crispum UTEX LB 1556]
MKFLFNHLQTMSGGKPPQKDKLCSGGSESSGNYVINKTKKIPIPQGFVPANTRSQANTKATKKTVTAQILHPLKSTLFIVLFAVPQIPIQFPRMGGIFSGGKALAQTSCPAGTISTPIDWQPTTNLQEFLAQTFNVAGIQTTFAFRDNPSPFGTVTDITPNRESVVDPGVYGGLPGPNLRWNIGPDKAPVPAGHSSTLTITFTEPVTLASPLTLTDVDRDGVRDNERIFQDRVTVTAVNGSSPVGLTGAAVGPNTRVTNRSNSVLAEGQNENALPSSRDGNVQITLSGAVTQIQIVYESGREYGEPGQDQTIGLAKINICAPTTPLGTIGDTVYNDLNANNVQDANEPVINAVPVTLTGAGPDGQFGTADDTTATTTTDTNGRYSFPNLPLGQYTVAVNTPPAGFTPTQTQSNPINLTTQNRNINTADFGFTQQAAGSIGDTVYNDTNANSIQDANEPGISGVTVTLTSAGPDGQLGTRDDTTAIRTTDTNGRYSFPNLPLGQYRVAVNTPPAGFTPTQTQPNPINLTTENRNINTADFGLTQQAVGSIGDTVYNDLNGNNIQDANEPGISGVIVTLTGAGPDNQFGTSDDTSETRTTDNNGRYSFTGLPLDRQYRVSVTSPPTGLTPTQTQPNSFNLTNENRNIDTADLGFRRPGGSIGDFIFNDRNGNGTPDPGESGIPDITVILRNPQGQEITRTTTGERGNYNFPGLQPGDYIVEVVGPNDLSPTGGTTRNVSITQPNQAIVNADFGFRGARLDASENLRLVKRITNVFRNGNSINDPRFTTFNPDDGSDDDNAPGWSQSQPVGIPRLDTPLQSGDEVEYTIYFLAEGNQLDNVRFCDAIPQGTTYNDPLEVNPPVSSDQIRVLSPLTPLPNDVTNICLDTNNSNGTVIVNLGNIPGGTTGFIRFRARIN